MNSGIFEAYSNYYNLIYEDKNYAAETAYVNSLLTRFSKNTKNILELGCGTGKHAGYLAGMGYHVSGIDKSETMLKLALDYKINLPKSISDKLTFNVGDIRNYETASKFDAVISLFHVMSYMVTDEDLNSAMQTVKKHLNEKGLFIFDCWHGPAVLKDKPVSRTKHFENEFVSVKRTSYPTLFKDQNVVDIDFEILIHNKKKNENLVLNETHKMQFLFEDKLLQLLKKNGLELIHSEEWMTGKPLSDNTWYGCYICSTI